MKGIFLFFLKVLVLTSCVYKNEPECEGESEVAEIVLVENSFIRGQVLTVAKEDATYTERYEILGSAENRYGYGIPRSIDWRTDDPELIEIRALPSEVGTRVEIRVVQDLFDQDTEAEPEATVTGCVTNDCSYLDIDNDCPPCELEICSNPLRVQGVVNIEGSWKIEGATLPFPVEINIQQTGHQIDTVFTTNANVVGKKISFDMEAYHYECELKSHETCAGEVTQSSTGENLGDWTATKLPY